MALRAVVVLATLAAAADGVRLAPDRRGAAFLQAQAGTNPLPKAGDNVMEKVPLVGEHFKVDPGSTSLECVVSLTIQYMLVYTVLAGARTYAEYMTKAKESGENRIVSIMQQASNSVNFAPMLAVLFLGCRMRVTWLTQGTGNPPEYVQSAMYCATYAVLANTLVVVLIPLFTTKVIEV